MENLTRCTCGGFLPAGSRGARCPHCGRSAGGGRARALVRGLACIAAGGAVSVTLMACYGPAAVPNDGRGVNTPPTPSAEPSSAPTPSNTP
jgi:hypothetical protein